MNQLVEGVPEINFPWKFIGFLSISRTFLIEIETVLKMNLVIFVTIMNNLRKKKLKITQHNGANFGTKLPKEDSIQQALLKSWLESQLHGLITKSRGHRWWPQNLPRLLLLVSFALAVSLPFDSTHTHA